MMERTDKIYIDFNASGEYLWCSDADALTDNYETDVDGDDYREKHVEEYVRCDLFEALQQRIAELEAENYDLKEFKKKTTFVLEGSGFRRCNIPACNCGSWHQVGGFAARFKEIEDVVRDAGINLNGVVLVDAIESALGPGEGLPTWWKLVGEAAIKTYKIDKENTVYVEWFFHETLSCMLKIGGNQAKQLCTALGRDPTSGEKVK